MLISAIILAAGESKRMGRPKQLLVFQGRTLIERAADTVVASKVHETIVVLGHQAEAVKAVLKDKPVRIILNPDYRQGMSTSLKAGLSQVAPDARAVLIMLGDQPGLTPETINQLIEAFEEGKGGIIVPVYNGRRGNPVLLDLKYIAEIMALTGDVGARQILAAHTEDVYEIQSDSESISIDIDTEQDYKKLR